jgi:replicative DNA helicase
MSALRSIQEPPPSLVNYDAEQAYLGACLVNNEVWHRMADRLSPEHFADPLHGRIYEAIGKLVRSSRLATPVTLKGLFDQDEALKDLGGAGYLVELAANVVVIHGAEDYAEAIIDLWHRRSVNHALDGAKSEILVTDPDTSAMTVIESLEATLSDIATSGPEQRPVVTASQAAMRATESAEAAVKRGGPMGVLTGIQDLDRALGGLQKSDLVVLAGRPSMGKTALATSMGKGAAEKDQAGEGGSKIGFFSLEMSAEQLGQRLIAMDTGLAVERQRSGHLSQQEIERMVLAGQNLDALPFWIDDDARLTVQGMTARARRLQRTQGLDMVVVDHLGLTKTPRGDRHTGLYEKTTAIVRDLKTMAKVLGIPVLLLVQLSRAVEQRDDKRPMPSDLRDSGAIEEEADVIMFVYREAYYLERTQPQQKPDEDPEKFSRRYSAHQMRLDDVRNRGDVIIGKNRQGALGTVQLYFDGPRQKFSDLQHGGQG